jgi:hypothetical protein
MSPAARSAVASVLKLPAATVVLIGPNED